MYLWQALGAWRRDCKLVSARVAQVVANDILKL
jgi:hypothetical protein